jgi:hypothetical protein
MQKKTKVSMKWCDLAQYQQLCIGCANNENRKRSKYQELKDKTK